MFLSSYRQNAKAKIASTTRYQDTIAITKKLDVTEKKLITFLNQHLKISQEQLKNRKKHEKNFLLPNDDFNSQCDN